MGKYQKVVDTDAEYSEELNPLEALLSLALIQSFVDGTPSEEELYAISEFLESAEITEPEEIDALFAKLKAAVERSNLSGLFNAAIDSLPEELSEDAVKLAVVMGEVDGELAAEEIEYVAAIAQSLEFSPEETQRIIEETLIELYSEEEEEEEEEEEY